MLVDLNFNIIENTKMILTFFIDKNDVFSHIYNKETL